MAFQMSLNHPKSPFPHLYNEPELFSVTPQVCLSPLPQRSLCLSSRIYSPGALGARGEQGRRKRMKCRVAGSGSRALPQCALVQPGNWGWPLPPACRSLSLTCTSCLLASCFFLSVSLGHKPWEGPPSSPSGPAPELSSLVVGEVPPEPDYWPWQPSRWFPAEVHFSELRCKFSTAREESDVEGAGAGQGGGLGVKPSWRDQGPPSLSRLPSSQETLNLLCIQKWGLSFGLTVRLGRHWVTRAVLGHTGAVRAQRRSPGTPVPHLCCPGPRKPWVIH